MVVTNLFLLLAILLALSTNTESAKILAVFPHTGKSHFFMFKPYVYELAKRGHQVTVVTHFPDDIHPPNTTYLSIADPDATVMFNSVPLSDLEENFSFFPNAAIPSMIALYKMSLESCQGLGHPNLKKFLLEKHRFDLLIVEFFNTDCWASLAHVYKVPLVGIFSSVMMPWHNDRFGNPDNPAYIGNHFLLHPSKMSFLQRVTNTFYTYLSKLAYRVFYNPSADAAVLQHLGPNIPPVAEIVKNTSLFLINTHFSLFQPRPLVPGIVELGGFHVRPPSGDIPPHILKYIEESQNGVIFFSFGSTVKCSTMCEKRLKIFQNVLSKLPERVIWKWEDDEMPGKPENVLLGKWFPQNEILAHPKVKLFITHSGLMGTEEAVFHGVPMLMLPLMGDQPINAALAAEKGVGEIVDYYSVTEESLANGLDMVLRNDRYSKAAKKLSKIFLDRPQTILDTAIYWTDYVIRYDGAPHLRSAVVDLAWYQEYLLDVLAFFSALLLLFMFLVRLVFNRICRRTKIETKTKKVKTK